ncbi:MAG: M56 family metallopeptidase [Planctomycetota bacterium]|nr:M56 family metallopeptidase [Planctomycetota bacterium]
MVIDSDFSAGVRLTIALFHFLWVGTLIGGASAVAGRLLARRRASLRYIVHLSTLWLMVIAVPVLYVAAPWITPRALFTPVGSNSQIGDDQPPPQVSEFPPRDFVPESVWIQESPQSQISQAANDSGNITETATIQRTTPRATSTASPILNSAVPYVVGLYAFGVWCMLARLAVGLWGGHRLRLLSSPVLDTSLLAMVQRQAARLRLATVPALVWCDRTVVPVVVGIARPVILLPAAIATNLRPELIESLLSHELAHIRRWDLAVNLMQRLIEALLFFHPVVWYVSSRVSAERENACDDLVLCAGWPRLHYAEALLQMAESVTSRPGATAFTAAGLVAATGESNSQFKRRVLRLLGHEESARLGWSRGGVSVLLAIAAIVVGIPIAVGAWNGPDPQEKAPTSPQPNGNQAQALGDPVDPREESPEKPGQSPESAAERDPIDEQLDRIADAKRMTRA